MEIAVQREHPIFSYGVIAAIVACYLIAALLLTIQFGPWEAVRQAGLNGFLALSWLAILDAALRSHPAPDLPPIRHPRFELALLLATLLAMVSFVTVRFSGQYAVPLWLYLVLTYGVVLGLFLVSGYGARGLGLVLPARRTWLAVLLVVGLNVVAAGIGQHLPPGEAPAVPAADLAAELTTPFSVLVLFVGLLVRAAIPEELVLRVGLQPRLASFMPAGWAIVGQALFFSAIHFPQQYFAYGQTLLASIGYLLSIENGLLAGYLWQRTHSLPLLVVVHLFAFPRFGI